MKTEPNLEDSAAPVEKKQWVSPEMTELSVNGGAYGPVETVSNGSLS